MSLYDDVMASSPLFGSNREALEFYTSEYEALGAKYGMTGDEFWEEAENSSMNTDDHAKIRRLSRLIGAARYFMKKEKK
jgi:hypothetical protein